MSEKILLSCETFEEYPDGIIRVKSNTNLMYIKKDDKVFVTREVIRHVISHDTKIESIIDYKDVIDGSIVLTIDMIKSNDDIKIKYVGDCGNVTQITPLDQVLNLKRNSVRYLNLNDINNLENYGSIKRNKL